MSQIAPLDEKLKPNPKEDGQKHINVWSKAKTAIGQLLSNFAHTPFRHPVHGFFASVEGFWYWAGSGRREDKLRRLFGPSARTAGQQCEGVPLPDDEFQDMVREAISCKIFQNREVRELLAELDGSLPFMHYYVYGKDSDVIVNRPKHHWQLVWIDLIRRFLRNELVVEDRSKEGTAEPVTVLMPDTYVKMADGTFERAGSIEPGAWLWDPKKGGVASPIDLVQLADGTWKAASEVQVGDELMVTEKGDVIIDQINGGELEAKVNDAVRELTDDDIPF